MNNDTLEVVPRIEQFGDWFMAGVRQGDEGWRTAAAHAQRAIAAYPHFPDWIAEHNPGVNAEFVTRFAGIGVKYMAELCVMECPGAKRLRKLPLPIQKRCMADSVEVAIQDREGRWTSLKMEVPNLTRAQAEQVFAKDRVRSLAEQRAWLEDQREHKRQAQNLSAVALASTGLPYRVTRTHFIIGDPEEHSLTWKQVARLMKDAKTLKA